MVFNLEKAKIAVSLLLLLYCEDAKNITWLYKKVGLNISTVPYQVKIELVKTLFHNFCLILD